MDDDVRLGTGWGCGLLVLAVHSCFQARSVSLSVVVPNSDEIHLSLALRHPKFILANMRKTRINGRMVVSEIHVCNYVLS